MGFRFGRYTFVAAADLASELTKSLKTVTASMSAIQDLFAAGAGLEAILSQAGAYVSTGRFIGRLSPTGGFDLVLEHGAGFSEELSSARMKEQVCAAICMRGEANFPPERRVGVEQFLAAYEAVQPLLRDINSARVTGHPSYQQPRVVISRSLDADAIARSGVRIGERTSRWTTVRAEVTGRQRRLLLLTPRQLLDCMAGVTRRDAASREAVAGYVRLMFPDAQVREAYGNG